MGIRKISRFREIQAMYLNKPSDHLSNLHARSLDNILHIKTTALIFLKEYSAIIVFMILYFPFIFML